MVTVVVLGGLVVSALAIEPKFCGFTPDLGWRIFKVDKELQHAFFGLEAKSKAPRCNILRHVKQQLEVWKWK
jgi:hypothetical protein